MRDGAGLAMMAARVLARAMHVASGVTILVLMVITLADVTSRELAGSGVPGAVELSEVLLVGVVFAGLAGAEANDSHVRTPLLTSRLPPRVAQWSRLAGMAVIFVFLLWMVWLTLEVGIESMERGEYRFGIHAIPIWPAKLFIPLGVFGLTVEYLIKALEIIRSLRSGGQPPPAGPEKERMSAIQEVDPL